MRSDNTELTEHTKNNKKKATYRTTTLIKASRTDWGKELIGPKKKKSVMNEKGTWWKEPGGTSVLHSSCRIFIACHWKQLEVIQTEVN